MCTSDSYFQFYFHTPRDESSIGFKLGGLSLLRCLYLNFILNYYFVWLPQLLSHAKKKHLMNQLFFPFSLHKIRTFSVFQVCSLKYIDCQRYKSIKISKQLHSTVYCSVLFKWKFFIQTRASCLPLSFHEKRGAIERGWVQNRPFSFEWKAFI